MIKTSGAPASDMGESNLGVIDLPITTSALKLLHDFNDLCDTAGSDGVTFGEHAAAWIDDDFSAQRGGSIIDELDAFTGLAKSQSFVVKQLRN